MESKKYRFLGMMGSGKTSIGKLTSKKLKLDFYDIDELIENKLKKNFRNIYPQGWKIFQNYWRKNNFENTQTKTKSSCVSWWGAFLNKNIQKKSLITIYLFGYTVMTKL